MSTWDELPATSLACRRGEVVVDRWSCGVNKRIQAGDQFLMLRQKREPRGIFAYGTIVRGSYSDTHWNDSKRTALYVRMQLEDLVDPDVGPIIPRARLDEAPFDKMHWDAQSSGTRVPEAVAAAVREEWRTMTGAVDMPLPDELDSEEAYVEGVRRLAVVNSYERNAQARAACIAYHGINCAACGSRLANLYGEAARDLIHVHHLRPVSTRGVEYTIDPIRDLRPVCPNCHAVIHRRSPPYSVEDVRGMLRQNAKT